MEDKIQEEIIPIIIEEIKLLVKKEKPIYITIEDFIFTIPNLNSAQKYHHINSNKSCDLRIKSDWEGLTGLK